MAKKQNTEPVHIGRRSWWDGKVKTECGMTFSPAAKQENSWTTPVTCADCKNKVKGHKH